LTPVPRLVLLKNGETIASPSVYYSVFNTPLQARFAIWDHRTTHGLS